MRAARKNTLIGFSRHIESQARFAVEPPMVMATMQRGEFFTAATSHRYQELAATSPLIAIFGEDLPDDLGERVRGVALEPSDPLCRDWTVLMLGPYTAAALVAREQRRGDDVPDAARLFDVAITHDRSLVTMCVRSLLDRML